MSDEVASSSPIQELFTPESTLPSPAASPPTSQFNLNCNSSSTFNPPLCKLGQVKEETTKGNPLQLNSCHDHLEAEEWIALEKTLCTEVPAGEDVEKIVCICQHYWPKKYMAMPSGLFFRYLRLQLLPVIEKKLPGLVDRLPIGSLGLYLMDSMVIRHQVLPQRLRTEWDSLRHAAAEASGIMDRSSRPDAAMVLDISYFAHYRLRFDEHSADAKPPAWFRIIKKVVEALGEDNVLYRACKQATSIPLFQAVREKKPASYARENKAQEEQQECVLLHAFTPFGEPVSVPHDENVENPYLAEALPFLENWSHAWVANHHLFFVDPSIFRTSLRFQDAMADGTLYGEYKEGHGSEHNSQQFSEPCTLMTKKSLVGTPALAQPKPLTAIPGTVAADAAAPTHDALPREQQAASAKNDPILWLKLPSHSPRVPHLDLSTFLQRIQQQSGVVAILQSSYSDQETGENHHSTSCSSSRGYQDIAIPVTHFSALIHHLDATQYLDLTSVENLGPHVHHYHVRPLGCLNRRRLRHMQEHLIEYLLQADRPSLINASLAVQQRMCHPWKLLTLDLAILQRRMSLRNFKLSTEEQANLARDVVWGHHSCRIGRVLLGYLLVHGYMVEPQEH